MLGASPASAGTIYRLLLNTSSLESHAAGPFSIDVQLVGTVGNSAIFGNFAFGVGQPLGGPTLAGDTSGDLASGFMLDDHTSFFNEFIQAFAPGKSLSFTMTITTQQDPNAFPDLVSFAILDRTGTEIPTLGLSTTGSDVFLMANIDSDRPRLLLFGSDATRAPSGGGPPISMDAPVITPEPRVNLLIGTGLIGLAAFIRRQRSQ